MKQLILATTNSRKIKEANLAAKYIGGIKIIPKSLDIHELQAIDGAHVAAHKAKEAFAQIKKPVVVTDTNWDIPALNGFPGPYMKQVAQWFTANDWINLIRLHNDKTIIFIEIIAFYDGKTSKIFQKDYKGVIANSARGKGHNSIEQVAEFNGRTLAEGHDIGKVAYKAEDYIWVDFLKWFQDYE